MDRNKFPRINTWITHEAKKALDAIVEQRTNEHGPFRKASHAEVLSEVLIAAANGAESRKPPGKAQRQKKIGTA